MLYAEENLSVHSLCPLADLIPLHSEQSANHLISATSDMFFLQNMDIPQDATYVVFVVNFFFEFCI